MSCMRLLFLHRQLSVRAMMRRPLILTLLTLAPILTPPPSIAAPPAAANTAYNNYVRSTEAHMEAQHSSVLHFLFSPACGQVLPYTPCVERVSVTPLPGALLHHWRATQFIPGAKAADLDRLLRNLSAYPALFAPQVERASTTQSSQDRLRVSIRMRQRHVLTVVLDGDYEVTFAQLDPQHRYSISRSIQIREIDAPNTSRERSLPEDEEHGFLWRQNTYWSYEEHDGGLIIQVESLSLTRSVPTGLGWALGPYIASIPRDSLEFTLRCITAALPHNQPITQSPIY